MLPRRQRIHHNRDFQLIWRRGLVIRGKYCTARGRRSTQNHHRFGFVVSSAVAKRATDRNLIKRRMRAIVRELPPSPPSDLIIYATRSSGRVTYQELRRDLIDTTTKLLHATNHRSTN